MVAKRAEGNQESDTHKITDIKYQLVSRRGNGDAESVDLQGAVGQMHRSTYTTCDPSQPVWKLSAPQIEVDNDEGFGTARNAVLRIGKVPVLWAPYFPIDDRRKTGLLFPQLGMSGRNGFDYAQPIYFNLAPNYDDTLTPRYMSRRGLLLDNEFRYLYNGGRGEVLTSYMPSDRLRDRDRGRVMFDGYHNVNSHWQARANLAWVSDERYVEDFANRLAGVTASNLQSTIGLYGTGQNWTAGIGRPLATDRLHPQRERAALQPPAAPVFQLGQADPAVAGNRHLRRGRALHPRRHQLQVRRRSGPAVHAQWRPTEIRNRCERWFALGREAVRVVPHQRRGLVHHADPGVSVYGLPARSRPGRRREWHPWPDSALAGHRPDHRHPGTAARQHPPSRSLPIGSIDAGLFFDRETSIRGKSFLQTLEPRLFYLRTPYRNQDELPIFDTRDFTFSWASCSAIRATPAPTARTMPTS